MLRVIVTRPEREAQQWVRDLSAQGLDAQALPLIRVCAVDQPAELARVWQRLAQYVAVMFVSGNAVDHFFAANPGSDSPFTAQAAAKTRAWATGPATARALLRAGVSPERLDAPAPDASQFDSEALWQLVATQVQAGDRVLIVRGTDTAEGANGGQGNGRDWLVRQLLALGAQADFVAAYQRSAPPFGAVERELVRQAATDGSVWLFSSAQAVANLRTLLPRQSWAQARALATHPRIAATAREAGFAVVLESRPTLPDVVGTLNQHLE